MDRPPNPPVLNLYEYTFKAANGRIYYQYVVGKSLDSIRFTYPENAKLVIENIKLDPNLEMKGHAWCLIESKYNINDDNGHVNGIWRNSTYPVEMEILSPLSNYTYTINYAQRHYGRSWTKTYIPIYFQLEVQPF
jgi:hypothetical protein